VNLIFSIENKFRGSWIYFNSWHGIETKLFWHFYSNNAQRFSGKL